jgi:biopolymer transport protein ExbD
MAVTLPASPFTLGPQRAAQVVSVTAAPVPAIYFQDQKVTLDELRVQLKANTTGPRTLIVKADRSTPYDVAVQIMNEGLKLGYSVVLAASPERQ